MAGNRTALSAVQSTMRIGVALILLAIVAAGCGSEGLTRAGQTESEPKTAPSGLVLKVEHLPAAAAGTRPGALVVALYEDGRVFQPDPQILIYPGPVLPTFSVARTSPERVEKVLTRVGQANILKGGGAKERAARPEAVTVVTAFVDGAFRSIRLADGSPSAVRLQSALGDLAVAGGNTYEPEAMAIFARPAPKPKQAQDDLLSIEPITVNWPLGGLETGCSVVSGEDVDRVVAKARRANELTRWRSRDSLWAVAFRPLLPGESSCDDIAS